MCSNYRPVTRLDRLLTFFGVEREKDAEPNDVFPTDTSPFIRLSIEGQEGGKPALVAEDGLVRTAARLRHRAELRSPHLQRNWSVANC